MQQEGELTMGAESVENKQESDKGWTVWCFQNKSWLFINITHPDNIKTLWNKRTMGAEGVENKQEADKD